MGFVLTCLGFGVFKTKTKQNTMDVLRKQVEAMEAKIMEIHEIYRNIPQFVPPKRYFVNFYMYEQGMDVLMHDLLDDDRNVFEELETDFGVKLEELL